MVSDVAAEADFDFVRVQRKWQYAWYSSKAFEPAAGGESKFFFTVPYPYVSGLLHVGHGRTYTNGDVIARFKRMAGFNVLWPMGFHITGTPVLAVSSKIAAGDEAALKMFGEYVSVYEPEAARVKEIVSSFSDPWNLVNYFSGKLIQDFQSMGFSLDLSRQFTTGDAEYNKFIEWQFGRFKQAGFLKQAAYPILYCVRDRNAVGEDDIKDADTDAVEVQKFTAFKFKLEGTQAFLVSCTLRPDTVFGITNMFVNPAGEYCRVSVAFEGKPVEEWFVSSKAAEKIAFQGAKVTVLERKPGGWFVGKFVVSPAGKRVPVLPASFVDASHASGFVHSVPAHAPFDYAAIEELHKNVKQLSQYPGLKELVEGISPIPVVEAPGFGEFPAVDACERMKILSTRERDKLEKATRELYAAEFYGGVLNHNNLQFSGRKVSEAKDEIAEWLQREGKAAVFFENSRPAVCRCGGEVVCAVLPDQWFLDYNAPGWKEKARDCLARMTVFPEVYRKQFADVFDWLDKRPCARRRGLGTRLPFNKEWIIESLSDSTIYMAFYTVIKAIRAAGIPAEKLSPEFFNFVFLGEGDAAAVAQAAGCGKGALDAVRNEFLYWYPNDQRHTSVAHITNHLSFFIFAHTAIFGEAHWPKAITLNELVISEGSKMSKSKGNVVLLNKISSQAGADVFRVYAAGAADFAGVMDYRQRDVEATRRSLRKFVLITRSLLACRKLGKLSGIGLWFASKFNRALAESKADLEGFKLRDYVQRSFYGLLSDFDYFAARATPEEKAVAASFVAEKWVALLAPVVPHTAEELWQEAGGKGFVSVAKWPEADESIISSEAEASEDVVVSVLADARKIASLLRSKGRKLSRLRIITASQGKRAVVLKAFSCSTPEEAVAIAPTPEAKDFVLKNFFAYSQRAGAAGKVDEFAVLSSAAQFLSQQLSIGVAVEREEDSSSAKAARAMPLRPALEFE